MTKPASRALGAKNKFPNLLHQLISGRGGKLNKVELKSAYFVK
jgi:hypothetical protein